MYNLRFAQIFVVAAATSGILPFAASAATISVSSATVTKPHQERAQLCVSLTNRGGEEVAGTENELMWDGDCATMLPNSCEANSAHGKNLSGTLSQQRDFVYKGLVLSFSNTNPIPSGELYCCEFLVHLESPGSCCRIRVVRPGGSDSDGNTVSVAASGPGQLCLADDDAPRGGGVRGPSNNVDVGSGGGGNFDGGDPGGGPVAGGGGTTDGGAGTVAGGGSGTTGGGSGTTGGGSGTSGGGTQATTTGGGVTTAGPAAGGIGGGVPPVVIADLGGGRRPELPEVLQDLDLGGLSEAELERLEALVNKDGSPSEMVGQPDRPKPAAPQPDRGAPAARRPPVDPEVPALDSVEPPQPNIAQELDTTEAAAPSSADEEVPGVEIEAPSVPTIPALPADQAKPSPRDVPLGQRSGTTRPRRLPLDEDEGWFGCQIGADPSGSAFWLVGSGLFLLLMRRRP